VSAYIKRKDRFPDEITHKRNTDHFGMGLNALCGAKANGVSGKKPVLTTVSRYVTCPACTEIITKRRAAARERMAAL
jgi:hypothetical protein